MFSNPSLAPKQAVLSEKGSEYRRNEKPPITAEDWVEKREGNKIYLKTGELLFQCPVCEAKNKPMFFSTEHDLNRHVSALHAEARLKP